jgi:hypothetical protein
MMQKLSQNNLGSLTQLSVAYVFNIYHIVQITNICLDLSTRIMCVRFNLGSCVDSRTCARSSTNLI